MAIVSFDEYWPQIVKRTGNPFKRTYERRFKARSDDLLDGPLAVELHPLAPQIGDPYHDPRFEDDPLYMTDESATCDEITIRQDTEHPLMWYLEAHYTSTGLQEEVDPTEREAEADWTFQRESTYLTEDIDGFPYVNSANDYYDPPQEGPVIAATLVYTRFEQHWFGEIPRLYQNTVNLNEFLGWAPGKVLVHSIKARKHREGGKLWWQVTYEFHFKLAGWNTPLLDQGTKIINKVTGKLKNIVDEHVSGHSGQTLLNGRGQLLTDGVAFTTAAVNDFDLTIAVDDVDNFPDATADKPFTVVIDKSGPTKEYMTVTAVDRDALTLTVTRAQRRTIAVAHEEGAFIEMEPYFLRFRNYESSDFNDLAIDEALEPFTSGAHPTGH